MVGEDEDNTEIGIVGERLWFCQQPAVRTAALAARVADAILEKQRLTTRQATITVPPHCGVELWDVIRVYDSLCGQNPQDYRVMGIRLDYSHAKSVFLQRLDLCSM